MQSKKKPQPTSITLIEAIRQDNQRAWNRFVRLYTPLVYSWCRNLGLKADDVSDIAQDVFVAVHRSIYSFKPNQKASGAFRSWLWGITRNKIQDHHRTHGHKANGKGGTDFHNLIQQVQEEDEPETVDGLHPRQILLQSAFEILEKEFNEPTWLCFKKMAVEGQTAREIGEVLDMSPKAVRQAKFRVTKKLRVLLEDDFPDLTSPS